MMKKLTKSAILAVLSVAATMFATAMATSACVWFVHQPEEPECLKDM